MIITYSLSAELKVCTSRDGGLFVDSFFFKFSVLNNEDKFQLYYVYFVCNMYVYFDNQHRQNNM